MALWGNQPDKVGRPKHLNPGNDAGGPLDRQASFHSDSGSTKGRSPGWNVPLEGTDPAQGLVEVIVCQSKPAAAPGTAGNEAPDFFFPKPGAVLSAKVGVLFNVLVRSVDVENNTIFLTSSLAPPWAAFVDNGNGTGTFFGTPGPFDVGPNPFIAKATDPGALFTTLPFTVLVTP